MALILAEDFSWRGSEESQGNTPLKLDRSFILASASLFTLASSNQRTGTQCLFIDEVTYSNSGSDYVGVGWITGDPYCSFYIKFAAIPGAAENPARFFGAAASSLWITNGGFIQLKNDANVRATSTTALSLNTWYKIQVHMTSASLRGRIWINDVLEIDHTGGLSSTQYNWFQSDVSPAPGFQAYVDDYSLCTTLETGDLRCATLVPTSDVQRGSWTGGAGGTTNLWDAVNNLPPIGTATETNLTQIESADGSGDNTTDEYVAGFPAWNSALSNIDALIAVRAFISTGEDVATGAKTGSFAITQNPNQGAYTAITQFGPAASGALGTHPIKWFGYESVVDASAVNVTTTPRVAVRKTDTGTRVASIDLIKLEVLYREIVGASIVGSWDMIQAF